MGKPLDSLPASGGQNILQCLGLQEGEFREVYPIAAESHYLFVERQFEVLKSRIDSEPGRIVATFENVVADRPDKNIAGGTSTIYDLGDLVLLEDGALFIAYRQVELSKAHFSPLLLFGAIGGLIHGFQRMAAKTEDQTQLSDAMSSLEGHRSRFESKPLIVKSIIYYHSLWFRLSEVESCGFNIVKPEAANDSKAGALTIDLKTSVDGVLADWKYIAPDARLEAAVQSIEPWIAHVLSVKHEKKESVQKALASISGLLHGDSGSAITASEELATLKEDKEKIELLAKELLDLGARKTYARAMKLLTLKLNCDNISLFREAITRIAKARIEGVSNGSALLGVAALIISGALFMFGVFTPAWISLFICLASLVVWIRYSNMSYRVTHIDEI